MFLVVLIPFALIGLVVGFLLNKVEAQRDRELSGKEVTHGRRAGRTRRKR